MGVEEYTALSPTCMWAKCFTVWEPQAEHDSCRGYSNSNLVVNIRSQILPKPALTPGFLLACGTKHAYCKNAATQIMVTLAQYCHQQHRFNFGIGYGPVHVLFAELRYKAKR